MFFSKFDAPGFVEVRWFPLEQHKQANNNFTNSTVSLGALQL